MKVTVTVHSAAEPGKRFTYNRPAVYPVLTPGGSLLVFAADNPVVAPLLVAAYSSHLQPYATIDTHPSGTSRGRWQSHYEHLNRAHNSFLTRKDHCL